MRVRLFKFPPALVGEFNARINEQSLAGGFFAAQREKGDR
jgi:hypothetical protein